MARITQHGLTGMVAMGSRDFDHLYVWEHYDTGRVVVGDTHGRIKPYYDKAFNVTHVLAGTSGEVLMSIIGDQPEDVCSTALCVIGWSVSEYER